MSCTQHLRFSVTHHQSCRKQFFRQSWNLGDNVLLEKGVNYDKQGQGNQCQTLWVKFESTVVQFSNFVTNLDILGTNLQPFTAIQMSHQNKSSKCPIKMSHQNVSSKCLIKMAHQDVSSKCLIKMSHTMSHRNVSSKCLINIFHQNVSSKCPIKMFHLNASSKCLIKMSHQNVSSNCFIKMSLQNVS